MEISLIWSVKNANAYNNINVFMRICKEFLFSEKNVSRDARNLVIGGKAHNPIFMYYNHHHNNLKGKNKVKRAFMNIGTPSKF